jgi:hypothetical protein
MEKKFFIKVKEDKIPMRLQMTNHWEQRIVILKIIERCNLTTIKNSIAQIPIFHRKYKKKKEEREVIVLLIR